jgi:hypothetical protein
MAETPDLGTLQAQFRAKRARYKAGKTTKIEIPGFEIQVDGHGTGGVWGEFRAIERITDIPDANQDDVEQAVDLIVGSTVSTEIRVAGLDPIPLTMPVGAALADWLGVLPEGQTVTDRQAVYLIFLNELGIAGVAAQINRFSDQVAVGADEELEGNSQAPS